MKRTILVFGLIAGAILSAMMAISITFHEAIGFDRAEVIGYTSMVLAFMLIFFGVRSYRDNIAGGMIRFGKAFGIGMSIAAVAALMYVVTWQVIYYNLAPDYITKYQEHAIAKARADGESEESIARTKAQMDKYVELYRNPAFNAGITFLEPMPVALIMSLVSAGVLSRRRQTTPT